MNQNQKGFANIVLVVVIVVLVGVVGYFALTRKSALAPQIATETNMSLTYPNGGEVLNLNQLVNIKYKISDDFRKKLSTDTLVELYLVRPDGVLEGYIGGITDYAKTSFIWDPQKLQHWGGLDVTFRPPQAGQYKVLILARSEIPRDTADIFVDDYDKFDGQKVLVVREGKILAQHDLIAKDISDSNFGIR